MITTYQCTFRRSSDSPKERGFAITRSQIPLFVIPEHVRDEVDTLPVVEAVELIIYYDRHQLTLDISI
jgi:hypothetical protein